MVSAFFVRMRLSIRRWILLDIFTSSLLKWNWTKVQVLSGSLTRTCERSAPMQYNSYTLYSRKVIKFVPLQTKCKFKRCSYLWNIPAVALRYQSDIYSNTLDSRNVIKPSFHFPILLFLKGLPCHSYYPHSTQAAIPNQQYKTLCEANVFGVLILQVHEEKKHCIRNCKPVTILPTNIYSFSSYIFLSLLFVVWSRFKSSYEIMMML